MNEIDGDPTDATDVSVDDHFNPEYEVMVVANSFVGRSPDGYEGADWLEYEPGDRVPREKVNLTQFWRLSSTTLAILNRHGQTMFGVDYQNFPRVHERKIVLNGLRGNGFNPTEYDTAAASAGGGGGER